MFQQPTSRRDFLRQSTIATSAATLFGSSLLCPLDSAQAAGVDRSINVETPSDVRQLEVLFDSAQYTAFPHVVRLDGDELLMAFRQAPRQKQVRHTHPRSVITVIRSYDLAETWDIENAAQLAAGGGQEFAPIYLGDGVVGGLLAMHEVVPVKESKRTGVPHIHKHEYPIPQCRWVLVLERKLRSHMAASEERFVRAAIADLLDRHQTRLGDIAGALLWK